MNTDIEKAIFERKRITQSFQTPIEYTNLLATDISDHKLKLDEVFKDILCGPAVIELANDRFKGMFGSQN